jgi:hypothetical protein
MTVNYQDREWDILYKANANLAPFVTSNYMAPNYQDRAWDLLAKLTNNIGNISDGVTGPIPSIPTPSGDTDFSGLPGGVAPPAGGDLIYFAVRDEFTYWTIGSGDTEWRVINKDSV